MANIILPGRTVGILGGGQLGRMFAIAARRMGYRVHAFDPTRDCPAGQVADVEVCAAYDDIDAAVRFARDVDVVTFEFENIPAETLSAVMQVRPVHPSPQVLHTCRHRLREKTFLHEHGFPVTKFRHVQSLADLQQALAELGVPAILKTVDFGYDGKGQVRIDNPEQAAEAYRQMGRATGILEAFVPFTRELSVICARGQDGALSCFPVAENTHHRHILDITTAPADVPQRIARDAVALAAAIAEKLEVVGLIAVEMFLVNDALLVNELAPRPHNSGHFTFDACITSQFEQQLRAVCGLPLGEAAMLCPAAMANLLGDLWIDGEPNWSAALTYPEVKLHLYGKGDARPGRKMGHLTALAGSIHQARERVIDARTAAQRGRIRTVQ